MEVLPVGEVITSLKGHENQCNRRIKQIDKTLKIVNIILGKSGTNMPLSESLRELAIGVAMNMV